MPLNRRHFLTGLLGASAAFAGGIPALAQHSGGRDPRLIVIVLRGALDGLSAVPAIGDPDFETTRGALTPDRNALLPVDSTFALHPALKTFAAQYGSGSGLIAHAAATGYRQRSHFDGQDVLESGFNSPGETDSGWLNRFMSVVARSQGAQGNGLTDSQPDGLAVGGLPPLIMRGPSQTLGWAPDGIAASDPDLPPRLARLYAQSDDLLAELLEASMRTNALAGNTKPMGGGGASDPKAMTAMAGGAAKLMRRDDGPRVGALALEGWDTHANEGPRLNRLLTGLDAAIGTLEKEFGPVWKDTVVLTVTEFGRTARINGTEGTDHGTGTVAFLNGGAVKGGRMVADWPGLKTSQLYQQRDLMPTTDVRAIFKGVLQELYDVSDRTLAETVFPDTADVRPLRDLIA